MTVLILRDGGSCVQAQGMKPQRKGEMRRKPTLRGWTSYSELPSDPRQHSHRALHRSVYSGGPHTAEGQKSPWHPPKGERKAAFVCTTQLGNDAVMETPRTRCLECRVSAKALHWTAVTKSTKQKAQISKHTSGCRGWRVGSVTVLSDWDGGM